MNPIKIKIGVEGQLTQNNKDKETVRAINAEIEKEIKRTTHKSILETGYIGSYDFSDMLRMFNTERKESIQSFLFSDSNDIKFGDCEYRMRFVEVNQTIQRPSDAVSWQLNFTLTSTVYTCIHIFENLTLICYEHSAEGKEREKELHFIERSKYNKLVLVP